MNLVFICKILTGLWPFFLRFCHATHPVLGILVYLRVIAMLLLVSAIPYTFRVSTGDGEDNGTESNVWVKVYGPRKKHTGRLFLELAQNSSFKPGSTEIFSIEAVEVDEVKKIEVSECTVW